MSHGINEYIINNGLLEIKTLNELQGVLRAVVKAIPLHVFTDNIKEDLNIIIRKMD